MDKQEKNNLDKQGRLPVSVTPEMRELFNRVLNNARRAGFNRSKFIVMAVLMAGVDLGLLDEVRNENN